MVHIEDVYVTLRQRSLYTCVTYNPKNHVVILRTK